MCVASGSELYPVACRRNTLPAQRVWNQCSVLLMGQLFLSCTAQIFWQFLRSCCGRISSSQLNGCLVTVKKYMKHVLIKLMDRSKIKIRFDTSPAFLLAFLYDANECFCILSPVFFQCAHTHYCSTTRCCLMLRAQKPGRDCNKSQFYLTLWSACCSWRCLCNFTEHNTVILMFDVSVLM